MIKLHISRLSIATFDCSSYLIKHILMRLKWIEEERENRSCIHWAWVAYTCTVCVHENTVSRISAFHSCVKDKQCSNQIAARCFNLTQITSMATFYLHILIAMLFCSFLCFIYEWSSEINSCTILTFYSPCIDSWAPQHDNTSPFTSCYRVLLSDINRANIKGPKGIRSIF